MKHKTTIDTIELQIQCSTTQIQREKLFNLERISGDINSSIFIKTFVLKNYDGCKKYEELVKDEKVKYMFVRKEAYLNDTKLFTISSGIIGDTGKYYINIKFAGLKTYKDEIDKTSNNFLYKLVSYLNLRKTIYVIRELDICIDVLDTKLNRVSAIRYTRHRNMECYKLDEKQQYRTTKYIEKILVTKDELNKEIKKLKDTGTAIDKEKIRKKLLKNKLDSITRRAYLYNKTVKDDLDRDIVRFEVKLQKNYFKSHGFNIKHIEKTLNEYIIMYFEDKEAKELVTTKILDCKNMNKRQVDRLQLKKYQLNFDISVVSDFIQNLESAKDYEEDNHLRNELDKLTLEKINEKLISNSTNNSDVYDFNIF
jgi:hypothetical protein